MDSVFIFSLLSDSWILIQVLIDPQEISCNENDKNSEKYFQFEVFSQCRLKSSLLEVLSRGWQEKFNMLKLIVVFFLRNLYSSLHLGFLES